MRKYVSQWCCFFLSSSCSFFFLLSSFLIHTFCSVLNIFSTLVCFFFFYLSVDK